MVTILSATKIMPRIWAFSLVTVYLFNHFQYSGLVDSIWHVPKWNNTNMVAIIEYYDQLHNTHITSV